jgi:hypothetical protein
MAPLHSAVTLQTVTVAVDIYDQLVRDQLTQIVVETSALIEQGFVRVNGMAYLWVTQVERLSDTTIRLSVLPYSRSQKIFKQ